VAATPKRNMKIPDETWARATQTAAALAELGYRGEHRKFSVADLVRVNLEISNDEPIQKLIERLGLKLPGAA
jgi:hypothetical protein